MNRVAIVGLSTNDANVHELERLAAFGDGSAAEALARDLADEVAASELVLLKTCNRIEVIFARESGTPPGPGDVQAVARVLGAPDALRGQLRQCRGRAAVKHLFRIACSLDSLVVGEDQILAQVRSAFGQSRDVGLTGPLLEPLFEAAIQVGKKVRSETELCRHRISVVALGVAALDEHFTGSDPAEARSARVALIGAGETSRLAGLALRDAGWSVALVVNRSPGPARALAERLGARPLCLEEFRSGAEAVDIVVSATSAPGFVLAAADLRRVAKERLIGIDLALPRDLEPQDEPDSGRFRLINLDTLRAQADDNRRLRAAEAVKAEVLIERKLDAFFRRATERRLEATVAEILAETGEVFEHELRGLANGRLAALSDEELRAVERWARSTFGRLAYAPLSAFKRLANELNGLVEGPNEEAAE